MSGEAEKRVHLSDAEFIRLCNESSNVAEAAEKTGMTESSIRQRRSKINGRFSEMELDSPLNPYRRGGGGGGVGSRVLNSTEEVLRAQGLSDEQVATALGKLRAKLEAEASEATANQEG